MRHGDFTLENAEGVEVAVVAKDVLHKPAVVQSHQALVDIEYQRQFARRPVLLCVPEDLVQLLQIPSLLLLEPEVRLRGDIGG